MTIFLSHSTAAIFWLYAQAPLSRKGAAAKASLSANAHTPTVQECIDAVGRYGAGAGFIEASTASCSRTSAPNAVMHLDRHNCWNSYLKAGPSEFIASPELAFLQAASFLDLPTLIEFGYALCSTYAFSSFSPLGFCAREQLTTPAKLLAFAQKNSGMRGSRAAKKALSYVSASSASPAETSAAMLLTLPHLHGGYGFRGAELNPRIDVNAKNARVASKSFYKLDLAWKDEKLAVEYDSDAFHASPEGIASDSKKRNALSMAGWNVISLTRSQLYSETEMDKVALLVAKRLGKRCDVRTPKHFAAKCLLRKQLLKSGSLPERVIGSAKAKHLGKTCTKS